MFNGECVPSVNPRVYLGKEIRRVKKLYKSFVPNCSWRMGGRNGRSPKVVDSYYMQDGRTIDNASDAFPYSEEGFTSGIRSFSGYRLNAGVYNMYVNREMRFYASIGFSEAYWPCISASSAGDYNLTVTYYYDSPNGKSNPSALVDHTPTGYVVKKYIHPMDAWSGTNARVVDKVFPMIRYAEILLSYAEALNNLTTTHTVELNGGETYTFSRDVNEIANAFNQVRYRAGLPGLSDAELQSQEKIQELLEKERMIEFLLRTGGSMM